MHQPSDSSPRRLHSHRSPSRAAYPPPHLEPERADDPEGEAIMPEFRKDPVTGRWVIIAAERAKRPSAFAFDRAPRQEGFCPFCTGEEHHTPEEILAYRKPHTTPNQPGWWLRVVPNKFPALIADEPVIRSGDGMYDRINGMGVHEVVIESHRHNDHIGEMDLDHLMEIVWAYRDRSIELRKDPRLEYVMIFKNHLREAGASLDHPHSQIIATPIIPKRVQEELDGAQRYYDYKERCVFCDMIDQELTDRDRVLLENDRFIAFMPYASRFPYEVCLLPRQHTCCFHDIQKSEVADLAAALRDTLKRLKDTLNDPPFNWILHTAPIHGGNLPYYHWHFEIIPKLTRPAGFEWGTGFYINPISPELAAKTLQPGDSAAATG